MDNIFFWRLGCLCKGLFVCSINDSKMGNGRLPFTVIGGRSTTVFICAFCQRVVCTLISISSFPIILPETGGICIAPRPSEKEAEIVPAIAMRPFYGITPVLMDERVSSDPTR